jgi:hypothetical protein
MQSDFADVKIDKAGTGYFEFIDELRRAVDRGCVPP